MCSNWKRLTSRQMWIKYLQQTYLHGWLGFIPLFSVGKCKFPDIYGFKYLQQTDRPTQGVLHISTWKRQISRQIWVEICETDRQTYTVKVFYTGKYKFPGICGFKSVKQTDRPSWLGCFWLEKQNFQADLS